MRKRKGKYFNYDVKKCICENVSMKPISIYSKLKLNFTNKLPMSVWENHSHTPQLIALVYNL